MASFWLCFPKIFRKKNFLGRFPSRSTLNTSDFSRLSRAHLIHSNCDTTKEIKYFHCLALKRNKPKQKRND